MAKDKIESNVLFVCSANLCRSPMASELFNKMVSRPDVRATSVGFKTENEACPEPVIEEALRYGIDLSGHLSQCIDNVDLDKFDLILCMTKEHVMNVVLKDNSAWQKTFLIKDFLRRCRVLGSRQPNLTIRDYVSLIAGHGTRSELLRLHSDLEIFDPITSQKSIRETYSVLNAAINELVTFLSIETTYN